MAQFINCPSCGFCYGVYMEFFNRAKEALYNKVVFGPDSKIKDHDPEKMALNTGAAPPAEPILDAIGIKNRCCRMHMVSEIKFDLMYK